MVGSDRLNVPAKRMQGWGRGAFCVRRDSHTSTASDLALLALTARVECCAVWHPQPQWHPDTQTNTNPD